MKRILLLAALFATSAISFAQWRNNGPSNNDRRNNNYNNSALVLTTENNQPFSVAIDGSYYQSNGNRVSVPNLSSGNHTIIVYENRRGIFGGNRQRQVYSANVYFKPGTEHYIYLNQNGQASFEERSLYQNGNYGNGGYGNNDRNGNYECGKSKGKGHAKHGHHQHGRGNDDNNRGRRNW